MHELYLLNMNSFNLLKTITDILHLNAFETINR